MKNVTNNLLERLHFALICS